MNSENGPDRRRIEFERRELRLNGKFSEAKELLESELSNKDKGRRHRALILKDIAPIYAELGEDEKSYDAYYEIVYPQSGTRTSMSSEPDVLVSFAEIAYKLGKKDEAADLFLKAVRNSKFSIGPHLPDVSPVETDDFRRLRAAAHLGNAIYHYFRHTDNLANELSVREARLAVQFDPSYEGAHFYLARILEYKSRDDLPEALKIYSKLLDSEDDKTREQARKSYKLISGIMK